MKIIEQMDDAVLVEGEVSMGHSFAVLCVIGGSLSLCSGGSKEEALDSYKRLLEMDKKRESQALELLKKGQAFQDVGHKKQAHHFIERARRLHPATVKNAGL